MRSVGGKLFVLFSIVALAVAGWWCQRSNSTLREDVAPPSPAAEMIVAGLGGFRGIVAEVIWFRADRLQDESRFAELAQLSTWLTFLEPHTSEVWAFAAWNLAYNISVTMPTPADRWRWVEAGIKLLRDDGLKLNPSDPALYRELAWMFLFKLGSSIDEASPHYRNEWKKTVGKLQAAGRIGEIKLDEKLMAKVDEEYGRQDWTDPLSSAIYWASRGFEFAELPRQKNELRQIIYQALMLKSRSDASFAPRALKEMRIAYEENPSDMLKKVIQSFQEQFIGGKR